MCKTAFQQTKAHGPRPKIIDLMQGIIYIIIIIWGNTKDL